MQDHLQLGHGRRGVRLARHRAPRLEPLPAGAESPYAGGETVGDEKDGVGGEQGRDLRLVGLKLVERRPDGSVLVGCVLQLDHGEGQAVHEQHDVRPAGVLPVRDGELVDGGVVVVVWVVEVDHAGLGASYRAVGAAVLDGDAVDQQPVRGAVALQESRRVEARELAVRLLERVCREVWVQPDEGAAEAAFEDRVSELGVAALTSRLVEGNVRAVEDLVAEFT